MGRGPSGVAMLVVALAVAVCAPAGAHAALTDPVGMSVSPGRVPGLPMPGFEGLTSCATDDGTPVVECTAEVLALPGTYLDPQGSQRTDPGDLLAGGDVQSDPVASLLVPIHIRAFGGIALHVNRTGVLADLRRTATTATGETLVTVTRVRMMSSNQLVVLTHSRGRTLSTSVVGQLSQLGRSLPPVRSVRCTAYVDRSRTTTAPQDLQLTRTQAAQACAALSGSGMQAQFSSAGRGRTSPRRSNATAAGRDHNRRLTIDISV